MACPSEELLERLAAQAIGDLDVAAHVEQCAACRRALGEIRANLRFLERLDADEASDLLAAVTRTSDRTTGGPSTEPGPPPHRRPLSARRPALLLILLLPLMGTAYGWARAAHNSALAAAQRDRAEHGLAAARRLTRAAMDAVGGGALETPGTLAVRRRLAGSLQEYLDAIDAWPGADPALLRESAWAHGRLAALLVGAPPRDGDRAGASAHHALAAVRIQEELLRRDGGSAEIQRGLAEHALALARILARDGDDAAAETRRRECLATCQALLELDARDAAAHRLRAGALLDTGTALVNADPPAAEAALSDSMRVLRAALAESPGDDAALRDLAAGLTSMASLHERAGNWHAARDHHQWAVELHEERAALFPASLERQRDVMLGLDRLAAASVHAGDPAAAARQLERAQGPARLLCLLDPAGARARRDLAHIECSRGEALAGAGRHREARASYEAALRDLESLAAESPGDATVIERLRQIRERLARSDLP